jgi:hypothetical protein
LPTAMQVPSSLQPREVSTPPTSRHSAMVSSRRSTSIIFPSAPMLNRSAEDPGTKHTPPPAPYTPQFCRFFCLLWQKRMNPATRCHHASSPYGSNIIVRATIDEDIILLWGRGRERRTGSNAGSALTYITNRKVSISKYVF